MLSPPHATIWGLKIALDATYSVGSHLSGVGVYSRRVLEGLAEYQPRTLATMHGASFAGDGAGQIRGLATIMREVLGE